MCLWDQWNVGKHVLKPGHNWDKLLGPAPPSLATVQPYLEKALLTGTWNKIGDAHGPGGKVVGVILEAEATA